MEEKELEFVQRIRQLAEKGLSVEIGLRNEEDTTVLMGKVSFVGTDYIEFVRDVQSESTLPDDNETVITVFNLTTIMRLVDIQTFTTLKDGAKIRQVSTAEGKKKNE